MLDRAKDELAEQINSLLNEGAWRSLRMWYIR